MDNLFDNWNKIKKETNKDNDYFVEFEFFNKQKNKNTKSSAMLLQIRNFSIKRITSKIGTISKQDFEVLKDRLNKMLFPSPK